MQEQPTTYYAVIFTSKRTNDDNGYEKMAVAMEQLAQREKGFLGLESAKDAELGITVSYWETEEDIKRWKEHTAHQAAQEKGKSDWYEQYQVRICKVEGSYGSEQ